MANPEHLAILKRGIEVWNKWIEENPDIIPDLSESDLSIEVRWLRRAEGIALV